ncbi:MAG: PP2C family protein-serine/threonine phosphatase, partial [Candidatus Micrarchaeota archaeon]
MAEKDPSLRPSFRRTRNLRPVPKVGFSLSVASISPFMRPRPILIDKPLLSTNEKLMGSLSEEIILRPGNRAFHTHPKLPGVEFTSEECADAAAIALSAQKYLVLSFSAPDGRLGMPDTKALVQDARFWSAAKSCDAEAMMACALKEALVSARAAALNTGNGAHASRSQARDDVEEALMFTEEYIYFKAGGEDSLPSIKRMSGLEKEFPESSFYELATKALDAKREGRQLADPDMEVDISGTTDVREEVMEETKMLGDLLETLIAPEKALIEKITGAKELDTKSLRTFLSMHPGKRDLLLQRGINRQWLSNGWREGLGLYQDIYRSIYAKCGIAKPTSEERREAALDPSNLSEEQRLCVSFIFPIGPDEKITPAHIIALDIWLRADREELERIWDQMYPSWTEVEALANEIKKKGFTTDRLHLLSRLLEKQPFELGLYDISSPDLLEAKIAPLRAAREMWFSPSKEERMDVWRYGSSDLFATASISHKLRYGGRYPKFTKDEDRIASFIFPGLTGMASLDRSAKEVAADIFRRYHTGREMPRRYHQIIYELARLPGMDVSSLRRAAYREAEFKTLSRFLGAPDTMPQTQIVKGMWGSRAKDKRDGSRPVNEDSCSSVEVVMEEGDVIRLDMVADGMGGHKRGDESSHETNGQAASRIAKEVFEICALAGWIMTPEDARLIVMMADLAIVKEQIGRKTLDDPSVENDMGCTMSIILQRNDSLWGVHAGDSDWKVFRNGEPVLLSIGHTGEWGALQDVRKEVEQLVRADLIKQGFDPYALDDDLKSAFNSRVDEWTH